MHIYVYINIYIYICIYIYIYIYIYKYKFTCMSIHIYMHIYMSSIHKRFFLLNVISLAILPQLISHLATTSAENVFKKNV